MDFIFDPSLAFYLPLHELDGSSFRSHDAYGHLCTVTGALYTAQGRSFDGIDDSINCGSSDVFDFTSAFTLAAWVKPGALAKNKFIISNRNSTEKTGWMLFHYSDNKFYLQGGDGVTWGSLSAHTVNTYTDMKVFYFVAGSFDGTGRVFVNGVADGTDTSDPLAASSYPTLVGNDTHVPTPFEGIIGEVFAFSRALTPQEIQHIYLATKWRYR